MRDSIEILEEDFDSIEEFQAFLREADDAALESYAQRREEAERIRQEQEEQERLEADRKLQERLRKKQQEENRLRREQRARQALEVAECNAPGDRSSLSVDMAFLLEDVESAVRNWREGGHASMSAAIVAATEELVQYAFAVRPEAKGDVVYHLISPQLIVEVLARAAEEGGMPREDADRLVRATMFSRVSEHASPIGALMGFPLCGSFDTEPTEEGWEFADPGTFPTTPAPEIDWVIPGFIPAGDVILLAAKGGTGKTMLAIQTGGLDFPLGECSLASFNPGRPLRVMMLLPETNSAGFHVRFESICKGLDRTLSSEQVALYQKNLKPLLAKSGPLLEMKGHAPQPTKRFRWLAKHVARFKPDLLIVDTKAKWDATDENSNPHQTAFVQLMETLIEHGARAVLLIHHLNKMGGGDSDPMTSESIRGASALHDICRGAFGMRLLTKGRAKALLDKEMPEEFYQQYVEMAYLKMNNGPKWKEPLLLKVLPSGCGFAQVEDLRAEMNAHFDMGDEALDAVLDALGTNPQSMTVSHIRKGKTDAVKAFYESVRKRLADPKMTDVQVRGIFERALDRNLIVAEKGNGRSKIPRVAESKADTAEAPRILTPSGN